MKRNQGKHTDSLQAKLNILRMLSGLQVGHLVNKSTMGYAAFPDYNFRWPQGAAFSVAKICREMESEGLINYPFSKDIRGYRITTKGVRYLSTHEESR